jgi:hypothetical protein
VQKPSESASRTSSTPTVLLDSQVQKLVEVMASYVPPEAGVTTLPSNTETALAPILAASWK